MPLGMMGSGGLIVMDEDNCTVSDCPLSGESLCAEDREKTFNAMIELALEIA